MLSGCNKPESMVSREGGVSRDCGLLLSLFVRSSLPGGEAMEVTRAHRPRQSGEAVLLSFIEALVERSGGGSEALERVASRYERIRTAL
jgi:hypothetical protein